MRDLLVKLENLRDSKDWLEWMDKLRDEYEERMYAVSKKKSKTLLSEADMIRHEMSFIAEIIGWLDDDKKLIKDKEIKEALIEDLEKSRKWRIDRLLGRTHEYKLDLVVETDAYTVEDTVRCENRWIECFANLPNKLIEKLELEETKVEEMKEAEVQEQIDALASLESDGGL